MDLKEEMEGAGGMGREWWLSWLVVVVQEVASSWSPSSQRIPVDLGSIWWRERTAEERRGEEGGGKVVKEREKREKAF